GVIDYRPGSHTRLPNRYYRFRHGTVDFFALDSNTLDSPPPAATPMVRRRASSHLRRLARQAHAIDHELLRDRQAVERWIIHYREKLVLLGVPSSLTDATAAVTQALSQVCEAVTGLQRLAACEAAYEA